MPKFNFKELQIIISTLNKRIKELEASNCEENKEEIEKLKKIIEKLSNTSII